MRVVGGGGVGEVIGYSNAARIRVPARKYGICILSCPDEAAE